MATGQRPDNFFLQRFEDSRRCLCADTNVGVDEIGRASPLHRRGLVPTDKGRSGGAVAQLVLGNCKIVGICVTVNPHQSYLVIAVYDNLKVYSRNIKESRVYEP